MTIEESGKLPTGIKVSGLTQGYGNREVLKDFSLDVPDRSIVALAAQMERVRRRSCEPLPRC